MPRVLEVSRLKFLDDFFFVFPTVGPTTARHPTAAMAKQGEGDARWVVKERSDGTNVNGWHWSDKNVSAWAHSRIKELIAPERVSVAAKSGEHDGCKVDEIKKVEGDATLYNRKGVLKVLYDLKVSGKWSSLHEEKDDRTHGEFKFELFDEDPEVVVTIDTKSKGEVKYKSLIAKALEPVVLEKSRVFIKELHAGAGMAMDGVSVPAPKPKSQETKVTDFLRSGMDQEPKREPEKKDEGLGCLKLSERFICSTMDIYQALTDKPRLEAITRSKAVSNPVPDGELNLMNGTVIGKYKNVTPGASISLSSWKLKSWDVATKPATCEIKTTEDENCTKLAVVLNGVPNKYRTETEGFWRTQIFQAIKIVMGYRSAAGLF